jgi:putative hydrolase of HD superfamily
MTPEQIVQRQFDAYNAKDLHGWAGTYAPDAEQFELHGSRLAQGRDAIRARMVERFKEPDLHAELLKRVVMGNVVVDHERVTRNFPEGRGTVELLCIYEVRDGFIRRASFAFGERKIA